MGCETKETCFDFRRVKDSFLVQIVPDISRTDPASCSMVPEDLATGLKRPGDETDHSHLPSAEFTIAPDISRTHPASCSMEPEALATGLKRPGDETDHSHLPSAEVTNEWSYSHLPTMAPSCALRLL